MASQCELERAGREVPDFYETVVAGRHEPFVRRVDIDAAYLTETQSPFFS